MKSARHRRRSDGQEEHGPPDVAAQAAGGGRSRSPARDGQRVRRRAHGCGGRRHLQRRLQRAQCRAREPPQRLPHETVGQQSWDARAPRPQAAAGKLFPRLAHRAKKARRAGPGPGGGGLLPRGRVHPTRRQARQDARDRGHLEVTGERPRREPRRDCRAVQKPAPGPRPLHLPVGRRARGQVS